MENTGYKELAEAYVKFLEQYDRTMDTLNKLKTMNKEKLREKILENAEDHFWSSLAKHNEDESGRDRYLSEVADEFDKATDTFEQYVIDEEFAKRKEQETKYN